MTDIEDINASDCCGNGCANCVLDVKVKHSKVCDKTGKTNVLLQYTCFRLLDKKPHSDGDSAVCEFHFKSAQAEIGETEYILDLSPGYHLMLRTPYATAAQGCVENEVEMKRKYLLRPYSPYWWDVEKMEFKILVNLKYHGPMTAVLRNLQNDNEVEFRGPIGKFEFTPDNKGDNVILIINQGVAIAATIPIIENILKNDEDLTRIVHLSCFENINHIYFRKEINDFQKYWNYKAHIYVAHELCEDCKPLSACSQLCKNFKNKLKYKEPIQPGRLDDMELNKVLATYGNDVPHLQVVLAGTGNFQQHFKDLLSCDSYGINKNNIYLL
uniref:FAD-binding FR-type domain-containing protein n=1 Tax=Musca domestica TaxID=7370 RepID=A0A1I8MW83_MUSDO